MRMPGKAGDILRGVIGAKIIEHEKGVEVGRLVITEGPLKMDAGPLIVCLLFETVLIFLSLLIVHLLNFVFIYGGSHSVTI